MAKIFSTVVKLCSLAKNLTSGNIVFTSGWPGWRRVPQLPGHSALQTEEEVTHDNNTSTCDDIVSTKVPPGLRP